MSLISLCDQFLYNELSRSNGNTMINYSRPPTVLFGATDKFHKSDVDTNYIKIYICKIRQTYQYMWGKFHLWIQQLMELLEVSQPGVCKWNHMNKQKITKKWGRINNWRLRLKTLLNGERNTVNRYIQVLVCELHLSCGTELTLQCFLLMMLNYQTDLGSVSKTNIPLLVTM